MNKAMILNQLFYDMWAAFEAGVKEHPQVQMKNLGYEVLDAVPQSICDGWWFTVKEFIEPLPEYLRKMEYNYEYWHNGCWKQCEYFKVAKGSGPLCCFGGSNCIKEMGEEEINKRKLLYTQGSIKNVKIDKIVEATMVFADGSTMQLDLS